MNVLLIKPPQRRFAVASPFATITTEAGIYPPLGLLQLATAERARGRHAVTILDMVAEGTTPEQLRAFLLRARPEVVGVTLHTDNLGDGLEVIRSARETLPGATVMAGGPHVGMYPQETLAFPEIDCAVCGEADAVFGPLLDRIAANVPIDDIPGVVTRRNRDRVPQKLEVDDLDTLPVPDYTLLPYTAYTSILTRDNPVAIIMTTRGCPFKCAYCPAGGTRLRRRSPALVAEEVAQCLALGIRDVMFFDEIFAIDHARVRDLCGAFAARGLKFRWNIRTRVGDITPDIVRVMRNAGCNLIQFGIESGTERILKLMNKNLELREVYEKLALVRAAGILTYGNFMLGSPTETDEEMDATVAFAKRLKLDFAIFGITVLLPKTEYYRRAIREGKVTRDFWGDYILNPLVQIDNAYWPDFDRAYLERKCRQAFVSFYLRPWYLLNYLLRIARPRTIGTHLRPAFTVFRSFLAALAGKQ